MTALSIFGRPATPGQVKTRLARSVGARQAARLYAAFTADVVARAREVGGARLSFWVAGDPRDPHLAHLPAGLTRLSQVEGGLGVRMLDALRWGLGQARRSVVVGTDSPSLPAAYLRRALALLDQVDVVLGPSADGGYYSVAARRVHDAMFDDVRFSTRHALGDTRAACRRAGLRVALTPPWYDVDTAADLAVLRAELSLDPSRAPHTARALRAFSPRAEAF